METRLQAVSIVYKEIVEAFRTVVEANEVLEENVRCDTIVRGFAERTPSSKHGENFRLPSGEYALVEGEEVLIRCEVDGHHGDAFTDKPKTYDGRIGRVFKLASGDRGDRAIFFASLNALLSSLGMIEGPVHCKEGTPKECGEKLAEFIMDNFGKVDVAHIGYQPGHLEACSLIFEGFVTDLNPENIGKTKFGRKILSGENNEKIIEKVDVACITGSTLTNGTLPKLLDWCETYDTEPIIYGVTSKGALKLLNMKSFCPHGREKP